MTISGLGLESGRNLWKSGPGGWIPAPAPDQCPPRPGLARLLLGLEAPGVCGPGNRLLPLMLAEAGGDFGGLEITQSY